METISILWDNKGFVSLLIGEPSFKGNVKEGILLSIFVFEEVYLKKAEVYSFSWQLMNFLSNRLSTIAAWQSELVCLYFFEGGGVSRDGEMVSLKLRFREYDLGLKT